MDDKNTFDHREVELWHGNYGEAVSGALKPELVAPSLRKFFGVLTFQRLEGVK